MIDGFVFVLVCFMIRNSVPRLADVVFSLA